MARKSRRTTSQTTAVPMPIQVQEDVDLRPLALVLDGQTIRIESIDDRCEVEEDWWKDNPVVRMYYRVTLEDGRQLPIFRNMVHGGWYLLRLS